MKLLEEIKAPTFTLPAPDSLEAEHGHGFAGQLFDTETIKQATVQEARTAEPILEVLADRHAALRDIMMELRGDKASERDIEEILAAVEPLLPDLAEIIPLVRDEVVRLHNKNASYFYREPIEQEDVTHDRDIRMYFDGGQHGRISIHRSLDFDRLVHHARKHLSLTRRRLIPMAFPATFGGLIEDKLVQRVDQLAEDTITFGDFYQINMPRPVLRDLEQVVAESMMQRAGVPSTTELHERAKRPEPGAGADWSPV